jgi:hypothetical protein
VEVKKAPRSFCTNAKKRKTITNNGLWSQFLTKPNNQTLKLSICRTKARITLPSPVLLLLMSLLVIMFHPVVMFHIILLLNTLLLHHISRISTNKADMYLTTLLLQVIHLVMALPTMRTHIINVNSGMMQSVLLANVVPYYLINKAD